MNPEEAVETDDDVESLDLCPAFGREGVEKADMMGEVGGGRQVDRSTALLI